MRLVLSEQVLIPSPPGAFAGLPSTHGGLFCAGRVSPAPPRMKGRPLTGTAPALHTLSNRFRSRPMPSLRRWLEPPPADDPEEALRARITHWIVLSAFVSVALLIALLGPGRRLSASRARREAGRIGFDKLFPEKPARASTPQALSVRDGLIRWGF